MKVLDVKNVYKKYSKNKKVDTPVLKGISITIDTNEFVGLMGASGSGKTTFLNVASGIDKCDAGDVYVFNQNLCSMKSNELSIFRRNNIGMVFQDFNLLNSLTVKENIMVPMILNNYQESVDEKVIEEITEEFGIKHTLQRYPGELSGGEQQRVAICRALINSPKIIFADEPTGSLDSKTSEKVLKYFKAAQIKYKTSILMVTHDPVAASYCDKVIFIKDGISALVIKKQGGQSAFLDSILKVIKDINTVMHDVEVENDV